MSAALRKCLSCYQWSCLVKMNQCCCPYIFSQEWFLANRPHACAWCHQQAVLQCIASEDQPDRLCDRGYQSMSYVTRGGLGCYCVPSQRGDRGLFHCWPCRWALHRTGMQTDTVKPVFKTTWEIGTTWELRTATSVPRYLHYIEIDLRNKTTSEFKTVFDSPLGVPNFWVPLYIVQQSL